MVDMDMISFQSACRCLVRVREREAKAMDSRPSSPQAPSFPTGNLTQDQQNIAMLSRIKVLPHG